jgi:hypothetical protein
VPDLFLIFSVRSLSRGVLGGENRLSERFITSPFRFITKLFSSTRKTANFTIATSSPSESSTNVEQD